MMSIALIYYHLICTMEEYNERTRKDKKLEMLPWQALFAAQINVGSCAYEMKGIIKKNTMNSGRTSKSVDVLLNTHLLSTSKAGEEIIRQFVEQGLVDNRVDLIAVIAPQYFDNSFKGTLRFLAKLGGKKGYVY